MRISTWNVNGVRARAAQVLEWIERERPDVLCLQEVKASPDQVPPELSGLGDYWACWHGHKGYSGVALLARKETFPGSPCVLHPPFDLEHRIAVAQVGELEVASIYVPNGGKDFPAKMRFLEALRDWAKERLAGGVKLVLCGDLNVARQPRDVHPRLQKEEQIGQTPLERALLEEVIGAGLVDLSRQFEPDNDRLFTWWAPWRNMRERNMGWRLDYVLAHPELARTATRCEVHREFGSSDHGVVAAAFDWAPPQVAGAPATEAVAAAKAANPRAQLPFDFGG